MNEIIIFAAEYLIFFMLVIFLWQLWKIPRKGRLQFISFSLRAVIIAFILIKIANYVYYNPRPFVADGTQALFYHSPDNGFPSEHATAGFLIAFIVFIYNKKLSYSLLSLACIVVLARVIANVHHFEDVFAGALIASIATYVSVMYIHIIHKK
jgi:undecaprenyl-diphosphatase